MVFPAAKLLTVALRQLSKPMAQYMQRRAQNSDVFKGLCVGLASRYNNVEQRIVNRFYGRSNKAATIRKLNEAKAIELGATVFGEFFIFGIAGASARGWLKAMYREAGEKTRWRHMKSESPVQACRHASHKAAPDARGVDCDKDTQGFGKSTNVFPRTEMALVGCLLAHFACTWSYCDTSVRSRRLVFFSLANGTVGR